MNYLEVYRETIDQFNKRVSPKSMEGFDDSDIEKVFGKFRGAKQIGKYHEQGGSTTTTFYYLSKQNVALKVERGLRMIVMTAWGNEEDITNAGIKLYETMSPWTKPINLDSLKTFGD